MSKNKIKSHTPSIQELSDDEERIFTKYFKPNLSNPYLKEVKKNINDRTEQQRNVRLFIEKTLPSADSLVNYMMIDNYGIMDAVIDRIAGCIAQVEERIITSQQVEKVIKAKRYKVTIEGKSHYRSKPIRLTRNEYNFLKSRLGKMSYSKIAEQHGANSALPERSVSGIKYYMTRIKQKRAKVYDSI